MIICKHRRHCRKDFIRGMLAFAVLLTPVIAGSHPAQREDHGQQQ
jgi:hypothetical protein